MGCYDTIVLNCPKCGAEYGAQSKSGECLMRTFYFGNVPDDVMQNVNRHAPFVCEKCFTRFKVEFNPEIKVVETKEPVDIPMIVSGRMPEEKIIEVFENWKKRLDKK